MGRGGFRARVPPDPVAAALPALPGGHPQPGAALVVAKPGLDGEKLWAAAWACAAQGLDVWLEEATWARLGLPRTAADYEEAARCRHPFAPEARAACFACAGGGPARAAGAGNPVAFYRAALHDGPDPPPPAAPGAGGDGSGLERQGSKGFRRDFAAIFQASPEARTAAQSDKGRDALVGLEIASEADAGLPLKLFTWIRGGGRGPGGLPWSLTAALRVCVTLGGDGTLLRAAALFGPERPPPPFLPFALGSLGFLTPLPFADVAGALTKFAAGALPEVVRPRLSVAVRGPAAADRGAGGEFPRLALNEVTVEKEGGGGLLRLDCSLDGLPFARLAGDGLIVASATGSTAHSLSAGGPIVHPNVAGYLFTPLAPHQLASRPVLLAAGQRLALTVGDAGGAAGVFCSIDGQAKLDLRPGDVVHVEVSEHPITTCCEGTPTADWLAALASKLGWSTARRRAANP